MKNIERLIMADTTQDPEEFDIHDFVSIADYDRVLDDIKNIKREVSGLYDLISEKNEAIELLSRASIDLISIDMELISTELYNAESRLNQIGTVDQFDFLRDVEKTKGLNMAYNKSKIFLEEAGSEAKMVIPTLNLIKLTLEKVSEKLMYAAEA